jgi:ferredoxin--NADP+ reductase
MEDMMHAASDELIICTDDGSYGEKGLVTEMLKRIIARGVTINEVVTIGPTIMMKFVTITAKEYNLPVIVSLNPVMVDGTGMCGDASGVGGKTKFVCVDGPGFDGHLVGLIKRQSAFKDHEQSPEEHGADYINRRLL